MKREEIDKLFGLETFDSGKELKTDKEILEAIEDCIDTVHHMKKAKLKELKEVLTW
jgi:hypothetical protein